MSEYPPASGTGEKQPKPGRNGNPPPKEHQFKKGDPRINRKGRPKSFDELRNLIRSIGAEQAERDSHPVVVGGVVALVDGKPMLFGGHIATNTEVAIRKLMQENPEKFLKGGWGDPPANAPVSELARLVKYMPEKVLARLIAGIGIDMVVADWIEPILANENQQAVEIKD